MAKTWDELAAGGYPAVLPEVCDHEQRIALLESYAQQNNTNLGLVNDVFDANMDRIAELERRVAAIEAQLAQEDAAWLDEMAARIVACGMRRG